MLCITTAMAQQDDTTGATVTGSIQSDIMIAPMQDEQIGTSAYDNKYFLTNTYVDFTVQGNNGLSGGARFELTQWPMPGFANNGNDDFKGWGLPNFWFKGTTKHADFTVGSLYDQFGSGFIFRTYEERTLGVDNSLLGARINYSPYKGINLKVLSGAQRNYWRWNNSLVSGADLELSLDEWIRPMQKNGAHLSIGGSWVNKYEKDNGELSWQSTEDGATKFYRLRAPEFVNAFDARIRFQKSGFNLLGEYAYKQADPNSLNGGIYRPGQAVMLSAAYSKKGLSVLAQAKRSENMSFRSKRADGMQGGHFTTSFINHQPAFTLDHTYALAALYPYATGTDASRIGEWAFQGAVGYRFKGRFAPKFKVNYSLVQSIDQQPIVGTAAEMTDGYTSSFFKFGKDRYYQDFNIQYEQKVHKNWELHATVMWQEYNRLIQNHEGVIRSKIIIFEPKWKINKRLTLRAEAQYLHTQHESGDWISGLLELSVAPYFMFSVSDMYGRPEMPDGHTYGEKAHYYNVTATANVKSHRIQLGFGRTRAGVNCSGGVCRYVPASKGFTINYNYNF